MTTFPGDEEGILSRELKVNSDKSLVSSRERNGKKTADLLQRFQPSQASWTLKEVCRNLVWNVDVTPEEGDIIDDVVLYHLYNTAYILCSRHADKMEQQFLQVVYLNDDANTLEQKTVPLVARTNKPLKLIPTNDQTAVCLWGLDGAIVIVTQVGKSVFRISRGESMMTSNCQRAVHVSDGQTCRIFAAGIYSTGKERRLKIVENLVSDGLNERLEVISRVVVDEEVDERLAQDSTLTEVRVSPSSKTILVVFGNQTARVFRREKNKKYRVLTCVTRAWLGGVMRCIRTSTPLDSIPLDTGDWDADMAWALTDDESFLLLVKNEQVFPLPFILHFTFDTRTNHLQGKAKLLFSSPSDAASILRPWLLEFAAQPSAGEWYKVLSPTLKSRKLWENELALRPFRQICSCFACEYQFSSTSSAVAQKKRDILSQCESIAGWVAESAIVPAWLASRSLVLESVEAMAKRETSSDTVGYQPFWEPLNALWGLPPLFHENVPRIKRALGLLAASEFSTIGLRFLFQIIRLHWFTPAETKDLATVNFTPFFCSKVLNLQAFYAVATPQKHVAEILFCVWAILGKGFNVNVWEEKLRVISVQCESLSLSVTCDALSLFNMTLLTVAWKLNVQLERPLREQMKKSFSQSPYILECCEVLDRSIDDILTVAGGSEATNLVCPLAEITRKCDGESTTASSCFWLRRAYPATVLRTHTVQDLQNMARITLWMSLLEELNNVEASVLLTEFLKFFHVMTSIPDGDIETTEPEDTQVVLLVALLSVIVCKDQRLEFLKRRRGNTLNHIETLRQRIVDFLNCIEDSTLCSRLLAACKTLIRSFPENEDLLRVLLENLVLHRFAGSESWWELVEGVAGEYHATFGLTSHYSRLANARKDIEQSCPVLCAPKNRKLLVTECSKPDFRERTFVQDLFLRVDGNAAYPADISFRDSGNIDWSLVRENVLTRLTNRMTAFLSGKEGEFVEDAPTARDVRQEAMQPPSQQFFVDQMSRRVLKSLVSRCGPSDFCDAVGGAVLQTFVETLHQPTASWFTMHTALEVCASLVDESEVKETLESLVMVCDLTIDVPAKINILNTCFDPTWKPTRGTLMEKGLQAFAKRKAELLTFQLSVGGQQSFAELPFTSLLYGSPQENGSGILRLLQSWLRPSGDNMAPTLLRTIILLGRKARSSVTTIVEFGAWWTDFRSTTTSVDGLTSKHIRDLCVRLLKTILRECLPSTVANLSSSSLPSYNTSECMASRSKMLTSKLLSELVRSVVASNQIISSPTLSPVRDAVREMRVSDPALTPTQGQLSEKQIPPQEVDHERADIWRRMGESSRKGKGISVIQTAKQTLANLAPVRGFSHAGEKGAHADGSIADAPIYGQEVTDGPTQICETFRNDGRESVRLHQSSTSNSPTEPAPRLENFQSEKADGLDLGEALGSTEPRRQGLKRSSKEQRVHKSSGTEMDVAEDTYCKSPSLKSESRSGSKSAPRQTSTSTHLVNFVQPKLGKMQPAVRQDMTAPQIVSMDTQQREKKTNPLYHIRSPSNHIDDNVHFTISSVTSNPSLIWEVDPVRISSPVHNSDEDARSNLQSKSPESAQRLPATNTPPYDTAVLHVADPQVVYSHTSVSNSQSSSSKSTDVLLTRNPILAPSVVGTIPDSQGSDEAAAQSGTGADALSSNSGGAFVPHQIPHSSKYLLSCPTTRTHHGCADVMDHRTKDVNPQAEDADSNDPPSQVQRMEGLLEMGEASNQQDSREGIDGRPLVGDAKDDSLENQLNSSSAGTKKNLRTLKQTKAKPKYENSLLTVDDGQATDRAMNRGIKSTVEDGHSEFSSPISVATNQDDRASEHLLSNTESMIQGCGENEHLEATCTYMSSPEFFESSSEEKTFDSTFQCRVSPAISKIPNEMEIEEDKEQCLARDTCAADTVQSNDRSTGDQDTYERVQDNGATEVVCRNTCLETAGQPEDLEWRSPQRCDDNEVPSEKFFSPFSGSDQSEEKLTQKTLKFQANDTDSVAQHPQCITEEMERDHAASPPRLEDDCCNARMTTRTAPLPELEDNDHEVEANLLAGPWKSTAKYEQTTSPPKLIPDTHFECTEPSFRSQAVLSQTTPRVTSPNVSAENTSKSFLGCSPPTRLLNEAASNVPSAIVGDTAGPFSVELTSVEELVSSQPTPGDAVTDLEKQHSEPASLEEIPTDVTAETISDFDGMGPAFTEEHTKLSGQHQTRHMSTEGRIAFDCIEENATDHCGDEARANGNCDPMYLENSLWSFTPCAHSGVATEHADQVALEDDSLIEAVVAIIQHGDNIMAGRKGFANTALQAQIKDACIDCCRQTPCLGELRRLMSPNAEVTALRQARIHANPIIFTLKYLVLSSPEKNTFMTLRGLVRGFLKKISATDANWHENSCTGNSS